MSYEIKKAPADYLIKKGTNRFPLSQMDVGDMFEAEAKESSLIYHHVKIMKRDDKQKLPWTFTIKNLPNYKIAVIRLS